MSINQSITQVITLDWTKLENVRIFRKQSSRHLPYSSSLINLPLFNPFPLHSFFHLAHHERISNEPHVPCSQSSSPPPVKRICKNTKRSAHLPRFPLPRAPSRVRTHNYIRYILPASHALSENILKKVAGIFGQSGKLSYLCTRKRGNNPGCRRYLTYFHRQEVVQEK